MKLRPMLFCIAGVLCALAASAAEPPAAAAADPKPAGKATEDLSATAEPRVNTSSATAQPAAAKSARGSAAEKQQADKLQLDTTIVTGNRELPKVLYIVPWKKADIGELPSQPFNSLLDEALAPVDRDVFRREVAYYGVISGTAAAPADGTAAKQQ